MVEYGDDGVALNILREHEIDMWLDFGSNKNLLVQLVSFAIENERDARVSIFNLACSCTTRG